MKNKMKEVKAFFKYYLPAILRVKSLLHHYDSTKGLWCTDIEPKDKTNFWQL